MTVLASRSGHDFRLVWQIMEALSRQKSHSNLELASISIEQYAKLVSISVEAHAKLASTSLEVNAKIASISVN